MTTKPRKRPDFGELFAQLDAVLEEAARIRQKVTETLRRAHQMNMWPERRRILGSHRPERRGRDDLGRMSSRWIGGRRQGPDDDV